MSDKKSVKRSKDQKNYQLVYPNPGYRFEDKPTLLAQFERLKWLNDTLGQKSGLTAPVTSESWKNIPYIKDIVDKLEEIGIELGFNERFSATEFIDIGKQTEEEKETIPVDTNASFGSFKEDTNKFAKYAVYGLAIITVILLIKLIL